MQTPARPTIARATIAAVASSFVVAAACGPSTAPKPTAVGGAPSSSVSASASTSASAAPKLPTPVPASKIGDLAEGTFGPRLVRGKTSSIVVYAPRASSGRKWVVAALDEADRVHDDTRRELAEAPEDASAWDVHALGDGFLLSWSRTTETGEELWGVPLGADGTARSAPSMYVRATDNVVAVRIVPLDDGTGLLTWGERAVSKGASNPSGTLFSLPIDGKGTPLASSATRVVDKLVAWAFSPIGNATVVAFVQQGAHAAPAKASASVASAGSTLDEPRIAKALLLGGGAKPAISDAVALTTGETAQLEIAAVTTGPSQALVVFGDRREIDAHLFASQLTVDGGKLKPGVSSKRAVSPRGEQSIASLISTKLGPVLMYETVTPRTLVDARRRFDIVRLGADGTSSGQSRAFRYPFEDNEPELASAGDDVALLTSGRVCIVDGETDRPRCDDADVRPWVLRFSGPMLTAESPELLYVGPVVGGAVHNAFELQCDASGGRCDAIIQGPNPPSSVGIARVARRTSPSPYPRWLYAETIEAAPTPRVSSATSIGHESQFAGLHATRAGKGAMVGWVTYWADDEGAVVASGKGKPKAGAKTAESGGAHVGVRMVDAAGEPLGPPTTISERALSKGDVAVAFNEVEADSKGKTDGSSGVIAYVSRAEGDEEVYVARVDATGKRIGGSNRITRAPGAASDVALTTLPGADGGYLLAWVDARKGSPAVYAVRLDKNGGKVGTEVKIGAGVSGDVADVSVAVVGASSAGPRVMVVWSDAREDPKAGFADVWATVVSGKDLKTLTPEHAIAQTKLNSHNPVVVARGDGGALVGWMEDDQSSNEYNELRGMPEWGAFVARLDGQSMVVGSPARVEIAPALGKGVTTGVSLDCPSGPTSCRVVVSYGVREGIALLAAPLPAAASAATKLVWSFHAAPLQEVAPSLVGNAAFFCEDGLEKDDGRVRRLGIQW